MRCNNGATRTVSWGQLRRLIDVHSWSARPPIVAVEADMGDFQRHAKSGPEHMQQEAPIADGIPVPPACRSIRARCWRQRARGCAPFHRAQCRWNGVSASRVDDLSRSRRDSNPILSAPLRESACRAAGPHRQTHGLVPWEARFPRRTQQ